MSFLKTLVMWEIMAIVMLTLLSTTINELSTYFAFRLITGIFLLINILGLSAAHLFECYGTDGNSSFFKFIIRKWNND